MIGSLSPITTIPPQMISYKEKIKNKKQWGKDTVDAYESRGRKQFLNNISFIENYEMVNGKFIYHHYFEQEGYKDWLTMLTQEFEVPSTLRHYDFMGKVINNLTEKLGEFPDTFRVEEKFESDDANEYVRTQSQLLHNSVKADINNEIKQNLLAQGIDMDRQNFQSEEEAMQYFNEVQELAQAMTPSQIQTYMATSWQSQGEIWGSHELDISKQRFKLPELERIEFKDMLHVSRCFRHFFITGDGYMQETWNPKDVFHEVSPDLDWIDEGEYVGRIVFMGKSSLIGRYGYKLKGEDIKKLEDVDKAWGGKVDQSGFPYNVYAPFADYKSYSQIAENTGYDPFSKLPIMGEDKLHSLTSKSPIEKGNGLYKVTELYWMSQTKIGKVVYIDPDTGELVKTIVDENFVVPEGWKQKKGDYFSGDEPNTVYWTWNNQAWMGKKIDYTFCEEEPIYFDIQPCEFQCRGEYSPFGAKLPVCGRVFNNRNAQPMSLVDLMKPYAIGHNVCMNQLYQFMEKEIGKFMVWDSSFFNNMKDWGGEDSWDKIALVAKELGHVFGDTSPQNTRGANPGNQLPKVIDMEMTAMLFSRAKLAEFFESRAMAQLGVNPQFLGDMKATETASGITTAVSQTQLNVQRFYTDFFEYKQRCLTMNLDFAQYTQATNQDITINYTKSDGSRAYIKMTGLELLLRNMHVYIVNSQELLRQMETIRNLFLTNNVTGASALDLIDIVRENSPAAIRAKMKVSDDARKAREDEMMKQQQQQIDQQGQAAQADQQTKVDMNTQNNQTKEKVAYIQTFSKQSDNLRDTDQSGTPDLLEYDKLSAQNKANANKAALQKDTNAIKRAQLDANKATQKRTLDLKEKELKIKEKAIKKDRYVAKVNKN